MTSALTGLYQISASYQKLSSVQSWRGSPPALNRKDCFHVAILPIENTIPSRKQFLSCTMKYCQLHRLRWCLCVAVVGLQCRFWHCRPPYTTAGTCQSLRLADRALQWCESYLSLQKQTFFVITDTSGPDFLDCNVPQGSVLGPVKFIAYTEDLANTITSYHLNYHLYADDTQVSGSLSVAEVHSTNERLQQCVVATKRWCSSRRLQLNPSKTELM